MPAGECLKTQDKNVHTNSCSSATLRDENAGTPQNSTIVYSFGNVVLVNLP